MIAGLYCVFQFSVILVIIYKTAIMIQWGYFAENFFGVAESEPGWLAKKFGARKSARHLKHSLVRYYRTLPIIYLVTLFFQIIIFTEALGKFKIEVKFQFIFCNKYYFYIKRQISNPKLINIHSP